MNGSTSPVPIRMKRKLRIDPLGLLRMRSALERWRPDCLHCHGYYAAAAALFLRASGLGSPIVYTVHADVYRGLQKSDFLIRWVAQTSDRVAAVSYQTAASVERFTGGTVRPRVISNGLDLARMKLPPGFSVGGKAAGLGSAGLRNDYRQCSCP